MSSLHLAVREPSPVHGRPARGGGVVSEAEVRRFEKENLLAALGLAGGRIYGRGGAADLLGVKPSTLASRLKKIGIDTRLA